MKDSKKMKGRPSAKKAAEKPSKPTSKKLSTSKPPSAIISIDIDTESVKDTVCEKKVSDEEKAGKCVSVGEEGRKY